MIRGLNDFAKFFNNQYEDKKLSPSDFVDKIHKMNDIFKIMPDDEIKVRFSFGEPTPDNNFYDWKEHKEARIADLPVTIRHTEFPVYEIWYDSMDDLTDDEVDKSPCIEVMLIGNPF